MRLTKKLIKIAYSFGFIVDKPIVDKMKLKEGDLVEVSIKRIKDDDGR